MKVACANENEIWSERTVSTDLKLRGLSISEIISLTYMYKSKWDAHTSISCGFGCADKTWTRTKSGVAESWNIDESTFIKNWIDSILTKRYKQ